MYKFESTEYLNGVKTKLETDYDIEISKHVWDSIVSDAGENAGMCLDDEKLSFEDNIALYDEYFCSTLEATSLDNIEYAKDFFFSKR